MALNGSEKLRLKVSANKIFIAVESNLAYAQAGGSSGRPTLYKSLSILLFDCLPFYDRPFAQSIFDGGGHKCLSWKSDSMFSPMAALFIGITLIG